MKSSLKVAVIVPAYKVEGHILSVLERIGRACHQIYVVDDACPNRSGHLVVENCQDPRVKVIFNRENLGVGGAVMAGYRAALSDGCDILVKIDGDGQMAPELLPLFIQPISEGLADYTKGNRFYELTQIQQMPSLRIFGNAILSFISKFSSGYWDIFDPTNGYTAVHARIVEHLPFQKISQRYFFESDMLFRLNTMRCVVMDIPMSAHYADEKSSLKINKIILEFLVKHILNFLKRIFYNYFLRGMSVASFELVFGFFLLSFGLVYGIWQWWSSSMVGVPSAAGTVMLAAMSMMMGLQLLLAFIAFDVQAVPKQVINSRLYPLSFLETVQNRVN
jgi:glycosyltransferase involved in cell wall biosynthesis